MRSSSSLTKTIFQRFSVLFVARILLKLFAFLNVILVARYLGNEGFGVLSFGLAFVWGFLILADGGMSELCLRDVSANPEKLKEYAAGVFSTKLAIGILAYTALFVSSHLLVKDPIKLHVISIVGIVVILDSFMDFFRAILQITQPNSYELASFLLEGLIKMSFILGAIFFTHQQQKMIPISWSLLLGSFVTCLLHYHFIHQNYTLWPPRFDWVRSVTLLRSGFVFIAIYVLSLLNFRIDIMMLSFLMGDSASGLYSVSSKLIEQALIIPMTIGYVSLPVISNTVSHSSRSFLKTLQSLLFWLCVGGALVSVVLFSMGQILIKVIFGGAFLNAQVILKNLCWVSILLYMKPVLEKGLYSVHKQSVVFWIYLTSCLIKIALNRWWIPLWGIEGAVGATLLCEVLTLCLLAVQLLSLKRILAGKDWPAKEKRAYVDESEYHLSIIH